MAKNSHIRQNTYYVEPFQEDFTGHLAWGIFGNQLLRCAGMHAAEHGFGVIHLHESSYSWVLSRLVIEMSEMPKTDEAYTVETWICKLYKLFTDRCFAITTKDGKTIGYAYSIWAMIDMKTRKPADLENLVDQNFIDCLDTEKPCIVKMPGRIRTHAEEAERTIETYYSDIDINGHVNSIKYIEHALNLFPKETFATQRVARFEIAYNTESYLGDTLSFYHEEKGGGVHAIEIRKNVNRGTSTQGEVVCRCQVEFKPYGQ
ncbi:MAG: thioesterase [Bacteroidaceae bacterium]